MTPQDAEQAIDGLITLTAEYITDDGEHAAQHALHHSLQAHPEKAQTVAFVAVMRLAWRKVLDDMAGAEGCRCGLSAASVSAVDPLDPGSASPSQQAGVPAVTDDLSAGSGELA